MYYDYFGDNLQSNNSTSFLLNSSDEQIPASFNHEIDFKYKSYNATKDVMLNPLLTDLTTNITKASCGFDKCFLIPIKLDLDIVDDLKLKDTFTWNLYETHLTPDVFAQILLQDWDLASYNIQSNPSNPMLAGGMAGVAAAVADAIRQQVAAFCVAVEQDDAPDEMDADIGIKDGISFFLIKGWNGGDVRLRIQDKHELFNSFAATGSGGSQGSGTITLEDGDPKRTTVMPPDETVYDALSALSTLADTTAAHTSASSLREGDNSKGEGDAERDIISALQALHGSPPGRSKLRKNVGFVDVVDVDMDMDEMDQGKKVKKDLKHQHEGSLVKEENQTNELNEMREIKDLKKNELDEEPSYGDIRIVIKIDVHVGSLYVRDQFEWPLFEATITPERFASLLCADLGISGEFHVLIASCIREQVVLSRLNFEEDSLAPAVVRYLREEGEETVWEPNVKILSVEEIAAIAKEDERNTRRARRQRQSIGAATATLNPGSGRRVRPGMQQQQQSNTIMMGDAGMPESNAFAAGVVVVERYEAEIEWTGGGEMAEGGVRTLSVDEIAALAEERASKYRHAFGTANKRDQCHDNLKVSRSAWDTNLVSANQNFIAVNLEVGGGGAFTVLAHSQVGKLPENLAVFNGHAAAVLDTDFNPFNDQIIASASEDCKAMVWTIPKGGLTESIHVPTLTLSGHGRKVGHTLFNPVADNILATSSADMTVKIWDISTGQEKFTLAGHTEIIQSISWSWKGDLLATACKDKKLRIFDVRSKKVAVDTPCHQGVKGGRVTTMGDGPYICTTGFSKSSDRQIFIWDSRSFATPIKQEQVDTASGLLVPYYDADTSMLYVAGKGDGNIRYYEWVEEDKNIYLLSEYKSSDPLRGLCFLPKRACNIAECEVARIFKVHPTFVEPISFKVPRKADGFQGDLFPNTVGGEPAVSTADWLGGKTSGPKMVNLEHGFVAPTPKEFVTSGTNEATSATSAAPMGEKEYQDAYHVLRKETEDLKSIVAARDTRIRQLEAQLASLGK